MQTELSTRHFIADIGPNPTASLRASGLSMFDHLVSRKDLSDPIRLHSYFLREND